MIANIESDIILQNWDGFGFKYIEKSDYPKVLESLQRNFYLDEPISKTLGITPERSADMDQKMSDILDLNHGSYYAFPLDQPDKIAAVLILWIHEKDKDLPYFEPKSKLTIIVRNAIVKLHKRYDIHSERNIDEYPEVFVISTEKEYRGKGLATEMYRKAIAKMKSRGYPIISSTFTNPFSRKIGERLGFKQVSRLDFKECLHEDGTPVFGEKGENHYAIETVLELK